MMKFRMDCKNRKLFSGDLGWVTELSEPSIIDHASYLGQRLLQDNFEYHFVQILFSMIEYTVSLLDVQKSIIVHFSEASESRLAKAPKAFYVIDMFLINGEFTAPLSTHWCLP